MEERLVDQDELLEEMDEEDELSIRPQTLSEYIGQEDLKRNMRVFLEAAKQRNEVVDHVLLYGPPGLGKTTLAMIIAREMETNIKVITGPSIEKAGDLAAVLTSLGTGDVLFIDEIHRLPKTVEEVLYSAMEDFCIDIMIGASDETSRNIQVDLPPFTLVGATTKAGSLSNPLRDRFGIVEHLEYYKPNDLKKIVTRSAKVFNVEIEDEAALEIAKRSRGTPRISNRLLKRVRDFSQLEDETKITIKTAQQSLSFLKIDNKGLDLLDYTYLNNLINAFNGGPVGLETLCSSIGEERDTIEYMVEPYLLKEGFIQRTPRGRLATEKSYKHLENTNKKTIS